MDFDTAVRTRRTHKAFAPQPVARATLDELFELARWVPNHHLTNPWRFDVLGSRTRALLEEVAEAATPGSAAKLRRAPTLVALNRVRSDDEAQDREDLLATAMAGYVVLLGAHARGLVGYWRTFGLLGSPEGRAALALPVDHDPLGLLYLGHRIQEQRAPDRAAVAEVVRYLD